MLGGQRTLNVLTIILYFIPLRQGLLLDPELAWHLAKPHWCSCSTLLQCHGYRCAGPRLVVTVGAGM